MKKPLLRAVGLAAMALVQLSPAAVLAQTSLPGETPEPLIRTAPAGAPNVVVVLLDDVGFGSASTFGGVAQTPTLDRLAKEGLRYNRFHTTAICSPTRAALLTGRNPHATGIGAVMNSADPRPGYNGFMRKDTASVAEVLRQNGYSTAMFGKWHQTPDWEVSPIGPFDRWPTGQGFEKFYGFQGGETDQFEPTLFDGTTPVQRPAGKDYHLTTDLVNQSIRWLQTQHSLAPQKPFFLYLATGGIHAPIQVPEDYIARYRGKFDQGWDKLRAETFARQKRLGVIPGNARLTPRPKEMPGWDDLPAEQRPFAVRQMEAYAGFLAHTDEQIGRLVDALKTSGQFDNTLFVYIVGDNGASAEGGLEGSLSYMGALLGVPEPKATKFSQTARIGGPDSYSHIPAEWAWATNAPFQWTKTIASHLGGIRNPMIVTWPKRIKQGGGIRSQFSHVNDITPTILDAAGLAMPDVVNGVKQKPMNGVSLTYSFTDAKAPERHTTQYFEVFGNRAIYHNGWMASAFHERLPWIAIPQTRRKLEDDKWELYDLTRDYSQANDLAAKEPKRLAELQALFMKEAEANNLLPLAGIRFGGAGLPDPSGGARVATYHAGTIGVPERAIPRMPGQSWRIDAAVEAGPATRGVVATLGGITGGWSLYIDPERRPVFRYRMFELKTVTLTGAPLPPGASTLRVDFTADGPGIARGGKLSLTINGEQVAQDTLPMTPTVMFSINETFDVGVDTGSAAGIYPADGGLGYPFRDGAISGVTISLK